MAHIVRKGDPIELWDGSRSYLPGAMCSHKGLTWRVNGQAAPGGICNPAIEPGGFAPDYWEKAEAPASVGHWLLNPD